MAERTRSDTVRFDIDPHARFAISPYIYGINFAGQNSARDSGGGRAPDSPRFRLDRLGGNRFSAYNWETNYSNAGSDYLFSNDQNLSVSRVPGEAIRARAAVDQENGAATLVTVPMLEYVAGDDSGPVDTADSTRATRMVRHFRRNLPARTTGPGTAADTTDDFVYQDEFVRWLDGQFPGSLAGRGTPIFFSLDNEPDSWQATHREVESQYADVSPRLLTYDGFITQTVAFASAVKRVAPAALVFGPATATWAGMATLGRYPSPDPEYGSQFFLDVYLDRLREAEGVAGTRLVDVLDIHWYPEVVADGHRITDDAAPQTPATIKARVQAPRSLWDPSFVEQSWVSSAAGGAIRLLPRLRELIALHYPGTRIAISEYYYGRAGDISGGIAQADVLGIFGREGVFAAALWPEVNANAAPYGGSKERARAYAFAAFAMYLDFDGHGGRFGDTGLSATTSDDARTSIYASQDANGRRVLVAINRSTAPIQGVFQLRGEHGEAAVHAFSLLDGAPHPAPQPAARAMDGGFGYALPAMSVTTFVIGE